MTAKILCVFNQKGGAGKTTTSVNVAGGMGIRGYRVLLVDMDHQNTTMKWVSMADEEKPFPASVISLSAMGSKMPASIRSHMDDYDLIIIDCPPAMDSPVPSAALLISDLAIIPYQPSPPDVWAAEDPKLLINKAQQFNEALIVRKLINMLDGRSAIEQAMVESIKGDDTLQTFNSEIKRRAVYKEAAIMGTTIFTMKTKAAVKEFNDLIDEILNLLELPLKLKTSKGKSNE